MNWSDYLRQQEVIENCRQHYYDSMVADITECDEDYDDDYDEDYYEEGYDEEDEE